MVVMELGNGGIPAPFLKELVCIRKVPIGCSLCEFYAILSNILLFLICST